jgi:hypothetical protein
MCIDEQIEVVVVLLSLADFTVRDFMRGCLSLVCVHMCVHMYVCMYMCMYVCMYVCT